MLWTQAYDMTLINL